MVKRRDRASHAMEIGPLTPDDAIKLATAAEQMFRRDYLIASVVTLLASNGIWAWAMRGVLRKLSAVEESRVQDQKEGERRAEGLAQRMAIHMDRATEATVMSLADAQARGKKRRATDAPILGAESVSQVKKLPEGP